MHDEWICLTGEKLAADGIGEAECASGHGADHHQLSSSILPYWVRAARGGTSRLRPTVRNSRRAVLQWRKMPPALSRA